MHSDRNAKFSFTERSSLAERLNVRVFLIQCLETAHPAQNVSISWQWVHQRQLKI